MKSSYKVQVRFEDPDKLTVYFQTSGYVSGAIVATVPGPTEVNWVLSLDEAIECFDVKGDVYKAKSFLLKPNGLDSEAAMKQPPWVAVTKKQLEATAMLLPNDECPKVIESYQCYRKYPVISCVRLVL